jgi:hypothetical protein
MQDTANAGYLSLQQNSDVAALNLNPISQPVLVVGLPPPGGTSLLPAGAPVRGPAARRARLAATPGGNFEKSGGGAAAAGALA